MSLKVEEEKRRRYTYELTAEQVERAVLAYAIDHCPEKIPADYQVHVTSKRARAQGGSVSWFVDSTEAVEVGTTTTDAADGSES